MINRWILFFCLNFFSTISYAVDNDKKISMIIDMYDLKPVSCDVDSDIIDERLVEIGNVIFNTSVFSGSKDTSCSTCHIDDAHLTDSLPISVGVGGIGEGIERLKSGSGVIVPRNSFTLFTRASRGYKTFFWDGKVEEKDGVIYSPIGNGYDKGFKSALSVAAIIPLLARDEFLGIQSLLDSSEHLDLINSEYYEDKIDAFNLILKKIIEESEEDENIVALKEAIEGSGIDNLTADIVGNSLASFIATKVSSCTPSKWDEYLNGNLEALTENQKDGAVVFFGSGRCSSCHSGSYFTDFDYNSIGVPQGNFGPYLFGQDIGRAGITYKLDDRFKFRTPSLIFLSKTAPYSHNGTFKNLNEIVEFHINPIGFLKDYYWQSEEEYLTYNKILSVRSNLLQYIDIRKDSELNALVDFLDAL